MKDWKWSSQTPTSGRGGASSRWGWLPALAERYVPSGAALPHAAFSSGRIRAHTRPTQPIRLMNGRNFVSFKHCASASRHSPPRFSSSCLARLGVGGDMPRIARGCVALSCCWHSVLSLEGSKSTKRTSKAGAVSTPLGQGTNCRNRLVRIRNHGIHWPGPEGMDVFQVRAAR